MDTHMQVGVDILPPWPPCMCVVSTPPCMRVMSTPPCMCVMSTPPCTCVSTPPWTCMFISCMYVSPYFSWSAVSCTTSLCPEMSDFYLLVRLDFPNLHVVCYCPHHTLHVGLTAGLSMLFYRSNSLSLYVAWKALEVCQYTATATGY